MSRAFVSDKEDWIYCPKAGERCMHAAEAGKECTETSCEHFSKVVKDTDTSPVAAKIVKKPAQTAKQAKASGPKTASAPARKTKKSKMEKPKKWGGRSGGFW